MLPSATPWQVLLLARRKYNIVAARIQVEGSATKSGERNGGDSDKLHILAASCVMAGFAGLHTMRFL